MYLVQGFREIGSSDKNDSLSSSETIQFDQKLVESLLDVRLVAGRSLASNSVEFVDEDNGRGGLASSGKEFSNPSSSHSDVPVRL